MIKSLIRPAAICAATLLSLLAVRPTTASVTVYTVEETTTPNTLGGNSSGKGVWFNPVNGFIENRVTDLFPTPLFENGKFFLFWDTRFTQPTGNVFTQGFFSNGNNVLNDTSGNPKKFLGGSSIGLGTGVVGGGFSDLGPTFGNWALGDRGYIGLIIGNGSTASANLRYGWADVTLNSDASVTLHGFAMETAFNTSIVAPTIVPEPTSLALIALGGVAVVARRRRA